MKISLCMIVKNEEKYIEMCLKNVLPLVDEAIIVDTGSTDRTLEIIESLSSEKIRVHNYKWNDNFAEARNSSLKEAIGDWILVLDADEKIIYDKEKLLEELSNDNCIAYNIPMYNFIDNKSILFSNVMIRLFKNLKPSYVGEIHEQITLEGKRILSDVTLDEKMCKIFHYGYFLTTFKEKNKINRNIRIIMEQLKKEPNIPFHWYNLGIMYMNEQKAKKALDAFIKSHELTKNTRYAFHEDLVLRMAECMLFLGENKKCKDFLEIVIKDEIINKRADFHYCLGLAYKKLKNYELAIKSFDRCIEIGEQISGISKQGRGSYLPKIEIAEVFIEQNDIEEATIKYMEAVFDSNNYTKIGVEPLKNLLEKHNMSTVLEELESVLNDSNKSKEEIKSRIKDNISSNSLDIAKELINKYEGITKNDPEIYSMKAIIAIMEDDLEKAEHIIDEGLLFDAKNPDLLFNKAYLYQIQNKSVDALKLYEKALAITTDNKSKIEIESHIKELSQEIESNSIQFELYKKRVKENIQLLIEQGLIKEAKKEINEYEKIIKNDIDCHSIKGIIAMIEGELEESERLLKEGISIDSTNFDLIYNLAYLYQSSSKNKLAIEYFNEALQVAENNEQKIETIEALRNLGVELGVQETKSTPHNKKTIADKDITNNIQNTMDEENISFVDELENYKKKLKDNIQMLIEQSLLQEAKSALKEYENIANNDIDVYSIKGVIAMIEGNFEKAEYIFDKALLLDSNNHDLLYNIAFLYENIDKKNNSIHFYKKLYHSIEDIGVKEEIREKIEVLGGSTTNKILIGSPIHQKPQILKEFLESLKELDMENMDVNYFFIDDNRIQESSSLLNEFSKSVKDVLIYKSDKNDIYICDEKTHNWKENLIWKVANFKNEIIQHAKINDYDYIFFLDSDLVLHPYTLKHLISTGKDIISEVFWTKWQPESSELPQVWLKDSYTQYEIKRDEQLSQEEILMRHKRFINKLKNPGIYKVGGLGACTLISRYSIDKGVNFSEIANLSFWGEDRHFCVRAVALGLSLYVDTHYPAYHIYREKDIVGLSKYKNSVTFQSLLSKNEIAVSK